MKYGILAIPETHYHLTLLVVTIDVTGTAECFHFRVLGEPLDRSDCTLLRSRLDKKLNNELFNLFTE